MAVDESWQGWRSELLWEICGRHRGAGAAGPAPPLRGFYASRGEYYAALARGVAAEAAEAFAQATGAAAAAGAASSSSSCSGGGARIVVTRQQGHVTARLSSGCAAAEGGHRRWWPCQDADSCTWASAWRDLSYLQDHLVEVQGVLYWVTHCETQEEVPSAAVRLRGISSSGRLLEEAVLGSGATSLHVCCFIGDYAARYRCALELRQRSLGVCRELEAAVLDPRHRSSGSYSAPSTRRRHLRTDLVPANPEQMSAVQRISSRVEVVHTPPGTGKSTAIFHLLSAHLPAGAAAVVTCVTSHAVDAVAEKFERIGSIEGGFKFVVLGPHAGLGATAASHSLEALRDRDALAAHSGRCLAALERLQRGLQGLLRAREEVMLREHTTSRLSPVEVACFFPGLLRRVATEILAERLTFRELGFVERRSLERISAGQAAELRAGRSVCLHGLRGRRDLNGSQGICERKDPTTGRWHVRLPDGSTKALLPENLCEDLALKRGGLLAKRLLEAHLAAVNRAKRALVRCTPLRVGRRSWNVSSFACSFAACLSKVRAAHQVAKATATDRTLRGSRVLICTVASSHCLRQLQADYPQDFPQRLFLGVLAEAGAIAESYTPLLLSTGVENLILLGDHRQLGPEVPASEFDEVANRRPLERSLMERVLDNGLQPHCLSEQYRMPQVLCSLLSDLFYEGLLRTAGQDSEGEPPTDLLCWFDVRHPESGLGASRANLGEVAEVGRLVEEDPLLSGAKGEILVVAFYKLQAELIRASVEAALGRPCPFRAVTVDAAQGLVAPHVIVSPVRSNRAGRLGLAADPRRLCTALSRAEVTLTIVGDASFLGATNPMWRQIFQHFEHHGEVTATVPSIPTALLQLAEEMAGSCDAPEAIDVHPVVAHKRHHDPPQAAPLSTDKAELGIAGAEALAGDIPQDEAPAGDIPQAAAAATAAAGLAGAVGAFGLPPGGAAPPAPAPAPREEQLREPPRGRPGRSGGAAAVLLPGADARAAGRQAATNDVASAAAPRVVGTAASCQASAGLVGEKPRRTRWF